MVLPTAFDEVTIDAKKISCLKEPIIKKIPRNDFYESCMKLL